MILWACEFNMSESGVVDLIEKLVKLARSRHCISEQSGILSPVFAGKTSRSDDLEPGELPDCHHRMTLGEWGRG